MKILVSAFACSPLWGSEPSVGWNWARELAAEHEVTVLTHEYFRDHIEPATEARQGRRLRFEYLAAAPRRGAFHEQLLNSQTYYLRWQRAARGRVLALLGREPFDLVHHVTWGNFRWPVPLYGLGVPLVVGPLGGGERAPASLYRGLPWRVRLKEVLRDLIIWTGAIDPWVQRGLGSARWVFCRTGQTIAALPRSARGRAVIAHDIGAPEVPADADPVMQDAGAPGALRCLFVGRLLAWKGAHFALRAVQLLHRQGVDVRFTLVGSGELEVHLRGMAEQLGIGHLIDWRQGLARAEVMQLYRRHDVFLFPSLHDSGGTVVLESLASGCPVVCVDLGGPPHFVNDSCGRVVQASDGDEQAIPARLAVALKALALDAPLRARLRAGALQQARAHSWPLRVAQAYRPVVQALALNPRGSA